MLRGPLLRLLLLLLLRLRLPHRQWLRLRRRLTIHARLHTRRLKATIVSRRGLSAGWCHLDAGTKLPLLPIQLLLLPLPGIGHRRLALPAKLLHSTKASAGARPNILHRVEPGTCYSATSTERR